MNIPSLLPLYRVSLPCLAAALLSACSGSSDTPAAAPAPAGKPALSVSVTRPTPENWPQTLSASGNVMAWQESVIGAEIGGFRITEVKANVGDWVKRGQVLARIDADTVSNDLAESRAAVAEAESALAEAQANVERSQRLREKGFYSAQQNTREQTTAATALARLNAAKARLQSAQLRRGKADVQAPDDGLIAARTATVGSLSEAGKELFRLIRGGRLEWRAEVTAAELHRLQVGQKAVLTLPSGETLAGTVRIVAPTVDAQTRTGLVYVDLPKEAYKQVGAGMFARGEFELGEQPALTLPQSAVLLRDGFAYVFKLENPGTEQTRVAQIKVETGRRRAERIEVRGLPAEASVVSGGAGFLADGDLVKVVPAAADAPARTQ